MERHMSVEIAADPGSGDRALDQAGELHARNRERCDIARNPRNLDPGEGRGIGARNLGDVRQPDMPVSDCNIGGRRPPPRTRRGQNRAEDRLRHPYFRRLLARPASWSAAWTIWALAA